jgi:hypothetical protein
MTTSIARLCNSRSGTPSGEPGGRRKESRTPAHPPVSRHFGVDSRRKQTRVVVAKELVDTFVNLFKEVRTILILPVPISAGSEEYAFHLPDGRTRRSTVFQHVIRLARIEPLPHMPGDERLWRLPGTGGEYTREDGHCVG